MYILLALLVVGVGVFQWVAPVVWYNITQSWKNDSASEPSELYIKYTRIGGAAFAFIGTVCLILLIIL